jgi:adenylate cyclase
MIGKAANKRWVAATACAVVVAALGYFLEGRIGLWLRQWSYDLLTVGRGEFAPDEAAIVYMDELSHKELGQPYNAPWDRSLHARLVRRLTEAGARAIVFDIVFSDPNSANPSADEEFAQAIGASRRVILAADNVPIGPAAMQAVLPFDLLLTNAAAFGSTEVVPDPDFIVRRHTPYEQFTSLSWAAAEFVGAKVSREATDDARKCWVNYYARPNAIPWVSFYEAIEPLPAWDGFFRDKVVFVGARMQTKFTRERKDEYRNPWSSWMTKEAGDPTAGSFIAGVEVQATAFLNLLRGDWLRRWPAGLEGGVIIALGLLAGFGLIWLRPVAATAAAAVGIGLVAVASQLLFSKQFVWFPWLIVVLLILVALAWSVIFNSVQLYVQKRLYEHTLSLYLPPKLVPKFAKRPELLAPGAEQQTLTIFFSDIAGFTTLSEGMDSNALAKLMNRYFHAAVGDCIHATEGTVVKFLGDGIFAFWNAPEPQADHALRACEAALRFRSEAVRSVDGVSLTTRIGVHTGVANVGNFGGEDRVDYTAMGENINLASRLEGLNKHVGTDCLISGATKAGIGESLLTRSVGFFQLKGFEKPVEVHELLGHPADAEATRAWREEFARALENYQQRNLEFAMAGFRSVLELRPNDGPARFYVERIEDLLQQTLPEEWSTHTVLKEK